MCTCVCVSLSTDLTMIDSYNKYESGALEIFIKKRNETYSLRIEVVLPANYDLCKLL